MHRSRALVRTLEFLRRGETTIISTPSRIGVGNFLYLWLRAFSQRERGNPHLVLETEEMRRWRKWFPEMYEDLVVHRRDVSFFLPRTGENYFQGYHEHFTPEELARFIDRYLIAEGSPFRDLVEENRSEKRMTVNVRRGDYYRDPRFFELYAFDIEEYVRVAANAAALAHEPAEILVVSDDPDWCRVNLEWLHQLAPTKFAPRADDPARHLAMLAASDVLVLANSSFSYWGGYASNRVHALPEGPSNYERVWCPWFHSRLGISSAAYQIDPRWRVVADIPSGWAKPSV